MSTTIAQTVCLPAPPDELFAAYLDPVRHAAITGAPVSIAPEPGAVFRAFEGALSGRILVTVPGRLIVQTWRSRHWRDDDLDSVLVLTLSADPAGGRIDLVHVNVPDHDHDDVVAGWPRYYWGPWRAYLTRGG